MRYAVANVPLLLFPCVLALDWADDLFNSVGANGIPGAGIVKNVIRWVGNMIMGLIHLGISVLKPVLSDAWATISHAADLAAQGIYTLDVKIANGLGKLTTTAYGWVLAAIKDAEALATQAVKDLRQWASDAIGMVGGALSALNRDVVQPLFAFAHDAVDWIEHTAIPAVANDLARLGHDVMAGLDDIRNTVGGILTKIGATVDRWLPVIEKAWDWLVWLGDHAFGDAVSLWHDLITLNPRAFLSGLEDAMSRDGASIEEWLTKWLGE